MSPKDLSKIAEYRSENSWISNVLYLTSIPLFYSWVTLNVSGTLLINIPLKGHHEVRLSNFVSIITNQYCFDPMPLIYVH
jgi:hypothetical protein